MIAGDHHGIEIRRHRHGPVILLKGVMQVRDQQKSHVAVLKRIYDRTMTVTVLSSKCPMLLFTRSAAAEAGLCVRGFVMQGEGQDIFKPSFLGLFKHEEN